MVGDIPRKATIDELVNWCVDELNKYDMAITMTEKKKWFRREFWRGHNEMVCAILETYLSHSEIKERLTQEAYERYFER